MYLELLNMSYDLKVNLAHLMGHPIMYFYNFTKVSANVGLISVLGTVALLQFWFDVIHMVVVCSLCMHDFFVLF